MLNSARLFMNSSTSLAEEHIQIFFFFTFRKPNIISLFYIVFSSTTKTFILFITEY